MTKFKWIGLSRVPGFVSISPEFIESVFQNIVSKNKYIKTYAQTAKHGLTDFTVTKKAFWIDIQRKNIVVKVRNLQIILK